MFSVIDFYILVLFGLFLWVVVFVEGVWVDGMFGVGGYVCGFLVQGVDCVIGIDCDLLVFVMVQGWVGEYGDWLMLVQGRFFDLDMLVGQQVDGVVLDLGVSLMQFDQVECGFFFMCDGFLDMCMGGDGFSVVDLLNIVFEGVIVDVLYFYGEECVLCWIVKVIVVVCLLIWIGQLLDVIGVCLLCLKLG